MRDKTRELSPSLCLLYAQLLEQISSPSPAIADVSFKRNETAWKFYWIRRVKIGRTMTELSLGRETDELLEVIEQEKKLIKDAKRESKPRENLVSMWVAGGANTIEPLSGRVLALLEGAGVFAAGGVLVGSHAFSAYGNKKWTPKIGQRYKWNLREFSGRHLAGSQFKVHRI
ncbi:MAG: hypothetical protein ACI915_004576, partial [Gammaproteobacteria bacterium]